MTAVMVKISIGDDLLEFGDDDEMRHFDTTEEARDALTLLERATQRARIAIRARILESPSSPRLLDRELRVGIYPAGAEVPLLLMQTLDLVIVGNKVIKDRTGRPVNREVTIAIHEKEQS